MTNSTARDLYARFHQLNTEVDELPEIAREKREKVEALLLHCFPWSYWYQMPWKHSLGIFIVLAGLDSLIIEAAKTDDPNKMIFDYLDAEPDPLNEEDLEDFRWHDLRHTWASWHIQNGANTYSARNGWLV